MNGWNRKKLPRARLPPVGNRNHDVTVVAARGRDAGIKPQWFKIARNWGVSTGPLAHPSVCLLESLTHLLARVLCCAQSFAHSLPSLKWMVWCLKTIWFCPTVESSEAQRQTMSHKTRQEATDAKWNWYRGGDWLQNPFFFETLGILRFFWIWFCHAPYLYCIFWGVICLGKKNNGISGNKILKEKWCQSKKRKVQNQRSWRQSKRITVEVRQNQTVIELGKKTSTSWPLNPSFFLSSFPSAQVARFKAFTRKPSGSTTTTFKVWTLTPFWASVRF